MLNPTTKSDGALVDQPWRPYTDAQRKGARKADVPVPKGHPYEAVETAVDVS